MNFEDKFELFFLSKQLTTCLLRSSYLNHTKLTVYIGATKLDNNLRNVKDRIIHTELKDGIKRWD